jgi:dsRNA-specific ribonuclease
VKVGDRYAGRGTGSTKKSAAQEAAKSILEQMDGVPADLFKLEA